jgi:ABC-type microcin C transport system duplicated ATPase subunit YejF
MSELLRVENLRVTFGAGADEVRAVDDISFALAEGETLAVVGESGSGKSVTALALTRLLPPPPTCRISGRIEFRGRDVLTVPERELRGLRGKQIAYIFQEPSSSLNPSATRFARQSSCIGPTSPTCAARSCARSAPSASAIRLRGWRIIRTSSVAACSSA